MKHNRDIGSNLLASAGSLAVATPILVYLVWLSNSDPEKGARILWACASAFAAAVCLTSIYHTWRPNLSRPKRYTPLEIATVIVALTVSTLSPVGVRAAITHQKKLSFADSSNVNERISGVTYQLNRLDPESRAYRDLIRENLNHSHFAVRKEVLVHLLGAENSARSPFLETVKDMLENDHSEEVQNWAKLVLQSAEFQAD